ncbi:MAG TPA: hypothetical protein VFA57_12735 [Pseudolabrys sp.]|nr:hypothetical protein [Pseudolabrys sp.]
MAADCNIFNFSVEAELFPARSGSARHKRSAIRYKRFPHAADAIRFAVEELPPESLLGAFLEIDGERYGGEDIRRLYDSSEFPLSRRTAPEAQ